MSIDGRIEGSFLSSNAASQARTSYSSMQSSFNADAIAYGVTTMKGFIGSSSIKTGTEITAEPIDYIAPHTEQNYCVCIDPKGELTWNNNVFHRPGKPSAHVIELVCSSTPAEHLAHLKSHQISYLIAGNESLDLNIAAEKLYDLFNIKQMLVCGGGITNKVFLDAGLIDELSIVIAPVVSGDKNVATLFDASPISHQTDLKAFKLIHVGSLSGNGIHLTYQAL